MKGYWSKELGEEWAVTMETEHVYQQWENYSQEFEEVRETLVDRTRKLRGTGCYNCPKYCHELVHIPGGGKYFLKSFRKLAAALAAEPRLELDYGLLALIQDSGLDESAVVSAYSRALDAHARGEELADFPEGAKVRLVWVVRQLTWGAVAEDAPSARLGEANQLDSALGVCPLLSSLRREAGFDAPYDKAALARVASLASGLELTGEALLRVAEENRRLIEEINSARRAAASSCTEVKG